MGNSSSTSKKNNTPIFYDTSNTSALLEDCLKKLHAKLSNIQELDENLIKELITGLNSETYVNWFTKNIQRNQHLYKSTFQVINQIKSQKSRPPSQNPLVCNDPMLKSIRDYVSQILNEKNLISIPNDKAEMWYKNAMRHSNNLKLYNGKKNIKKLKSDIGLIILLAYSYMEEKTNNKKFTQVLRTDDERVKIHVQNEINPNLNNNKNNNLKRNYTIENANNAKHQKLIEKQSDKINQYIQELEQAIHSQSPFEKKALDVQRLSNKFNTSNQIFIKNIFPYINHFESTVTSFYDTKLDEIVNRFQNILKKFYNIQNYLDIQSNQQDTISLYRELEKIIQNAKCNDIKKNLDQHLENIKRKEEEFKVRDQEAKNKQQPYPQKQSTIFTDLDSKTNHSLPRTEYSKATSTEQIDSAFNVKQKYDKPKADVSKQRQETVQTVQLKNDTGQNSSNDDQELKIVSLEKYFTFNHKNLQEEFGSIAYMDKILQEARKYETKVKNFKNVNHSVEYFILDENLMKLIEYLDKIRCTKEEPERRLKKNQVLKYIESLHDMLDDNIIKEVEEDVSNIDKNKNNKTTATKVVNQLQETVHTVQPKNDPDQNSSNDDQELKIVSLEKYFTFNPKNLQEEFGSIAYMDKILQEARKYETKVKNFKNVNHSVEYFILDENLMKLIEYMDKIKCTKEEPERRRKKNQVLKYIESLHDMLDDNIIKEVEEDVSNIDDNKNNKTTATKVVDQLKDNKAISNIKPNNYQQEPIMREHDKDLIQNIKATADKIRVLGMQVDKNDGYLQQYITEFENLNKQFANIKSESNDVQSAIRDLASIKNQVYLTIMKKTEINNLENYKQQYTQVYNSINKSFMLEELRQFKDLLENILNNITQFKTTDLQFMAMRNDLNEEVKRSIMQLDAKIQQSTTKINQVNNVKAKSINIQKADVNDKIKRSEYKKLIAELNDLQIGETKNKVLIKLIQDLRNDLLLKVNFVSTTTETRPNLNNRAPISQTSNAFKTKPAEFCNKSQLQLNLLQQCDEFIERMNKLSLNIRNGRQEQYTTEFEKLCNQYKQIQSNSSEIQNKLSILKKLEAKIKVQIDESYYVRAKSAKPTANANYVKPDDAQQNDEKLTRDIRKSIDQLNLLRMHIDNNKGNLQEHINEFNKLDQQFKNVKYDSNNVQYAINDLNSIKSQVHSTIQNKIEINYLQSLNQDYLKICDSIQMSFIVNELNHFRSQLESILHKINEFKNKEDRFVSACKEFTQKLQSTLIDLDRKIQYETEINNKYIKIEEINSRSTKIQRGDLNDESKRSGYSSLLGELNDLKISKPSNDKVLQKIIDIENIINNLLTKLSSASKIQNQTMGIFSSKIFKSKPLTKENVRNSKNDDSPKTVPLEKYFTFNPKNITEEFGSIAYMDKILEEARKYENKVKEFKNVNHSVEYFILDENLMKLVEIMDKIKCTKEEPERKKKKNQVLKYINSLHDILDDNIIEDN